MIDPRFLAVFGSPADRPDRRRRSRGGHDRAASPGPPRRGPRRRGRAGLLAPPRRGWPAAFGATVAAELRRWARQRVAVASAFLLPIGMASLLAVALDGLGSDFRATFAVVDEDGGPVATAFLDEALGGRSVRDVVSAEPAASQAEARRLVAEGEADAAIVLPPDLSESLVSGVDLGDDELATAGAVRARPGAVAGSAGGLDTQQRGATTANPAGIEVLHSDEQPIAGDLADLLVDQFETRARASVLAVARTGSLPTEPPALEVAVTAPDGTALDGATTYGPPVGVFFVLATLGFTAHRLVADRQRGVVERLAAAPVSVSAVTAGRAVAAVVVGGLSLGTLALTLQLVFGRSWGPALLVAIVALAIVVAMAAVAALAASLSRTPGQAHALSIGLAFVFLLASGSFGPATRPRFAELVPTTHAIDAFALLATEDAGMGTVAPQVAALVGFAGAAMALAWAAGRAVGWRFG